jgi:hypothetical protein
VMAYFDYNKIIESELKGEGIIGQKGILILVKCWEEGAVPGFVNISLSGHSHPLGSTAWPSPQDFHNTSSPVAEDLQAQDKEGQLIKSRMAKALERAGSVPNNLPATSSPVDEEATKLQGHKVTSHKFASWWVYNNEQDIWGLVEANRITPGLPVDRFNFGLTPNPIYGIMKPGFR